MNKPISITINETRISLVNVCNKSGLPPCILEPIVKNLYDEIKHLAEVQLKQDEKNFYKSENQEQEKLKENNDEKEFE